MYYLGIDWATEKHDLCLLDEAGVIVQQLKIEQSNAGFKHFEELVSCYGAANIRFNIERSDGLLVDWMVAHGWAVHITPPVVVAHRRPRRSKSDPSDAYLLAYLLRLKDPDCRPLTRSSPLVLHLRELARALDSTISDQRRLANSLNYLLYQYFPAANRLFAHVECLICLAFLEAFPTLEEARALTRNKLKLFLKKHDYKFMDRLDFIYAQLQAPMPTAAVSAGYIAQVQIIIPLLRQLHRTRSRLERELPALFMSNPEAAWWKSFPGSHGPLTPARLLAWIGDDCSRFPNAETLQAIAEQPPSPGAGRKPSLWSFAKPARTRCGKRSTTSRARACVTALGQDSIWTSRWGEGTTRRVLTGRWRTAGRKLSGPCGSAMKPTKKPSI